MGRACFLVENLFSAVQFPDHTVSANEEATGAQAWRVADGRRSGLSRWLPTTANNAAWIKAACNGVVRAANVVVLDRGHNLAGYPVIVQASDDDTTWRDVASCTIPSVSAPASVDDANGVLTEEGVWVKRFDLDAAVYWRLSIAAMGAGLLPQIPGLWLGRAWEPSRNQDFPLDEDGGDLITQLTDSDVGWTGARQGAVRRSGTVTFHLGTDAADEQARYHLQHYALRRPMWCVFDTQQAERALCATRPLERLAAVEDQGWLQGRTVVLPWVEHEPAVL